MCIKGEILLEWWYLQCLGHLHWLCMACSASFDHRFLESGHYHQLESQDISLTIHVLYGGSALGSWVMSARRRGFFMVLLVGGWRREEGHKPCHKPEMGSREFVWVGQQCVCLLTAHRNCGSCGSEQTGALAGCWGSIRWPSMVVQPRRAGGCSLLAICAWQTPAKTVSHRNPCSCSLSFWQVRR